MCPLLISIDEVHVLYTHRSVDTGSPYTLYTSMKSVLSEGVKYDFAVISLSTESRISSIAPSKGIAPSMRERERNIRLPVPFTELPFDVYIRNERLVPGQLTLGSVGSLEFTARFGRPLFYSMYLSRKTESIESNVVESIMRTVREKLSGRPWPPEERADKIDASSIAVLSARLLLELFPVPSARPYEEELVRNHLRILYSVPESRETFATGSSPEPLIAEASAHIMNYCEKGKEPHMDLWNLLGKFVDHGLASQGAIGELIGRALSISAMDRAINRLPESDFRQLKYQAPVKVTDYYRALLTDEAWEDLDRSIPANGANLTHESAIKPFGVAFQDAYFHFSHYLRAKDSFVMRDTDAWAFWLRGTAIACYLNQKLTDRMTPIYFSDRGNVSPKTISVNLDQDKTSRHMKPPNVSIQSAEELEIFSWQDDEMKLPYIAAVHCYALTENEGISVKQPSSYVLRNQTPGDLEAPRYQIDFRGLSAYGNITDQNRILIRAAINRSQNAVFNDHSRPYGVESVLQLLPVMTENPVCKEWY